MSADPLRTARREELAGLPAYVADVPGPTRAALLFRVGQADETLPTRGLTHLVEHLALGHFARADAVDGAVDVLYTFAVVEGAPHEVTERLHEIAARFSDPPTDRLDTERRILDVENRGKSPHPSAQLLSLFYGPRGPGLMAYDEIGLRHATARDVCDHAQRWFTRENAALALTGPVGDLSELPLRAGVRRGAVQTTVLPQPTLPAEIALADVGMALGAPLRSGDVVTVLTALIERKVWSVLRQTQGLVYDVECRVRPVGPSERLLYLTSDAGPDDAGAALKVVVQEIQRLAQGDFSREDLAEAQDDLRRRAASNPLMVLTGAAMIELGRGEVRDPAEILAGQGAVTPDEIAAVAGDLSEQLIATLPEGKSSGVLLKLDTATNLVKGTRYERRQQPRNPEAGDLIVGQAGLSAIAPTGHVTTVEFDACVAAIREPGDALALVGETGAVIVVDPADVENGLDALVRIEATLRPELIVPAEGSSSEQDAAARAHRQDLQRLRERVQGLKDDGSEEEANALVADAIRKHPDDDVIRQLERQTLGTPSTSTPARVVWNRNAGG